ncbi:MAG: NosD domain-containing protein, partial [Methanosarcina sp.]
MQQVKGTFLIKGITSLIFSMVFALNLMTAGSTAAPLFVNSSTDSIADFTSIQDAINAANPGDEIIVQPGTYVENIKVTKNVTIHAESDNPSDTILQAANNSEDTCSILSNDVTLRSFSIRGSTLAGIHSFGATDCHIENNRISNNTCGIDLCLLSSGNRLDNNEISGSVTGISLGDSWYNILSNNKISNCESGISLFDSPNNELEKNLLFSNIDGISLIGESNGNNLTNNTINSNKKSGLYIYGTSNNAIYNNYFNNYLNVQSEQQMFDANSWNITPSQGANIVGGPYFGGNFWTKPDGTVYPEGAEDSNLDGIYDVHYNIEGSGLIDPLPLKKLKPALITVGNSVPENNLTQNSDFTFIQDAVNSAFPGDTILVSPGIYRENINIYITNLTVVSESENPEDTIIQAANSSDDIFYIGADGVKVSGFNLVGPIKLPNSEIYLNKVKDCQIENNWLFANNSSSESGFGIRADLSD